MDRSSRNFPASFLVLKNCDVLNFVTIALFFTVLGVLNCFPVVGFIWGLRKIMDRSSRNFTVLFLVPKNCDVLNFVTIALFFTVLGVLNCFPGVVFIYGLG